MSVTPVELALISPLAALLGVALGIAGNSYVDRQRERRTARRGQDQAIAELLTATVDLITSVQAVRAAYQQQTPWRHYIRVAAILMAAIGSTMKSGERLSSDLLHWHRAGPGLERVLAADRDLDDKQRTIALDLATVVGPRTTRFYAAVAVLTLGEDKRIADAFRDLADEAGKLVEQIAAKSEKIRPSPRAGRESARSDPGRRRPARCWATKHTVWKSRSLTASPSPLYDPRVPPELGDLRKRPSMKHS